MTESEQWGESVNGIMNILANIEKTQEEFNYFDPYLNESIRDIEKFISEYVPKENFEIKDRKLLEKIEIIKYNYIKIGLFFSKIFLEKLFTEKEMNNFQNFIKKLCFVRDEIYEAISFCDEQNPNSETIKILNEYKDKKILNKIENLKRNYLLLGFLLIKPKSYKEV